MKIAVIGAGNIGGTLAKLFAKANHTVFLGVRNQDDLKVKNLLGKNISAHTIKDAAKAADVIVTAAYPTATRQIAKQLGDVKGKVIIDTMNTFRGKPKPFKTTAEALLAWTNSKDVARCFNTTGWQNIQNPNYKGTKIDMFIAGSSTKAKKVAAKLAKDVGFGKIHDLGGPESFELMEQIVIVWVGLSQILGRNIAMQILKR